MRWTVQGKRLHCAYLRARAALHRIAQSLTDNRTPFESKRALVTMSPTAEGQNLDEVWSIRCVPAARTILPNFNGRLWVQYRKDGSANLKMIAECAPLGRISASKICTRLLQELASRIERHAAAM